MICKRLLKFINSKQKMEILNQFCINKLFKQIYSKSFKLISYSLPAKLAIAFFCISCCIFLTLSGSTLGRRMTKANWREIATMIKIICRILKTFHISNALPFWSSLIP